MLQLDMFLYGSMHDDVIVVPLGMKNIPHVRYGIHLYRWTDLIINYLTVKYLN